MANPFAGFDPSEYFSTRAMQPHAEVAGGPSGIQALLASIAKRRAEDLAERQFQAQMENQRLDNERADAQQREQFRISNQSQIDTESEHRLAHERTRTEDVRSGNLKMFQALRDEDPDQAQFIGEKYGIPFTRPAPPPAEPPPVPHQGLGVMTEEEAGSLYREQKAILASGGKLPPSTARPRAPMEFAVNGAPQPPPRMTAAAEQDWASGNIHQNAAIEGSPPAEVGRDPRAQMLETMSQAGVPMPGLSQMARAIPGAPPVPAVPSSFDPTRADPNAAPPAPRRLPPSKDAMLASTAGAAPPPSTGGGIALNDLASISDEELMAGARPDPAADLPGQVFSPDGRFRIGGGPGDRESAIDSDAGNAARRARGIKRTADFEKTYGPALLQFEKESSDGAAVAIEKEAFRRTLLAGRSGDLPETQGALLKFHTDQVEEMQKALEAKRRGVTAAGARPDPELMNTIRRQSIEDNFMNNARKTAGQWNMHEVVKDEQRLQAMAMEVAGAQNNAALAAITAGAFVKMAQGGSGVISDSDMRVFWNRIGGVGIRTLEAFNGAWSGELGTEKQQLVMSAVAELERANQSNQRRIGKAIEADLGGKAGGAEHIPRALQTLAPNYWQEKQEAEAKRPKLSPKRQAELDTSEEALLARRRKKKR